MKYTHFRVYTSNHPDDRGYNINAGDYTNLPEFMRTCVRDGVVFSGEEKDFAIPYHAVVSVRPSGVPL